MNVLSSYTSGLAPPSVDPSSQDAILPMTSSLRMAKRRRVDSNEEHTPRVGHWDQATSSYASSTHPYQPPSRSSEGNVAQYGPAKDGTSLGLNADYASVARVLGSETMRGSRVLPAATSSSTTAVAAALSDHSGPRETPEPGSQWQASPYPDVASYSQQPYFYQQTDPSMYKSPWPPTDASGSYAAAQPTSSYALPPSQHTPVTMPYFPPPQTISAEQSEDYDATVGQPVQRLASDVDPSSTQYRYPAPRLSQSAHDSSRLASSLKFDDASIQLKNQSLPILDNLATQLIHSTAKASFPQIQSIMRCNDTEDGQAYSTLKSLFEQTRKVYSRETPFIDAISIQMFQPTQQEITRKANVATFITSILGSHDVSFFHLNEYFMETFVPLGHRLLKWQGAIYLELKTQIYISALMNSDGHPESMLDELFPPDLDAQILTRHPDAPSLSPSETDFIDRCRARKSYLLAEDSIEEALHELPRKYQWSDFVREFASCISKNVDSIMNVPMRLNNSALGNAATDRRSTHGTSNSNRDSSGKDISSTSRLASTSSNQNGNGTSAHHLPSSHDLPDPFQKSTTSSSSTTAAASASTIRQPWSKAEEEALLSGLGLVNGPHWSQILALYGRGGSVNEILKDRNQVQLKDKARNLKLWYLKMGKDLPASLQGVTGELRKRGGARARAALGLIDATEEEGEGQGGPSGVEEEKQGKRGRGGGKKGPKMGS